MIGIHDLGLFVVAGLLLNVTPGPDMAYIGARGAAGGYRAGLAAALGITAGFAFSERPFWDFIGQMVWGPTTNFVLVAVPLFLLFIMWVHILRISRPKVNPPRALALMSLAALLAVSIWKPALSQGAADLAKVPNGVGLDWFYLPLYPLTELWGNDKVWAFLGAFSLMIALMPWLPPLRSALLY